MKGSHPRPADRCPFVLRHSICQVTSVMQLGMLCMGGIRVGAPRVFTHWCKCPLIVAVSDRITPSDRHNFS